MIGLAKGQCPDCKWSREHLTLERIKRCGACFDLILSRRVVYEHIGTITQITVPKRTWYYGQSDRLPDPPPQPIRLRLASGYVLTLRAEVLQGTGPPRNHRIRRGLFHVGLLGDAAMEQRAITETKFRKMIEATK